MGFKPHLLDDEDDEYGLDASSMDDLSQFAGSDFAQQAPQPMAAPQQLSQQRGDPLASGDPADDALLKDFISTQAQGAGSMLDSGPPGSPPPMPGNGNAPSFADSRNDAYANEQKINSDLRTNALNKSQGLQAEDAIFPAVASLLDLFTNKGRGLGQIAAGTLAGVQARQKGAQQSLTDLGQIARQSSQDQRADSQRDSQQQYYDHIQQNQDARLGLDQQREDRIAAGTPEEKALLAAQTQDATARAGLSTARSQFAQQHQGLLPDEVALQAERQNDNQFQKDRFEHDKTHTAERDAASDAKTKAQQDATAVQMAETKRKTGATEARQFNKDAASDIDLGTSLRQLQPMLDKYKGGDIPGVGPLDRFVPDMAADFVNGNTDASEISQLRNSMLAAYSKKQSGLNTGVKEADRLAIVQGSSPGASEEQFRVAVARAQATNPLMLSALGTGREDAAAQVLQNAGLGQQPQAPAAPEQQPNATAGRMGKDPAQPIRMGNGAPPAPAALGGGGGAGTDDMPVATSDGAGNYTITWPDGHTEMGDEKRVSRAAQLGRLHIQ